MSKVEGGGSFLHSAKVFSGLASSSKLKTENWVMQAMTLFCLSKLKQQEKQQDILYFDIREAFLKSQSE